MSASKGRKPGSLARFKCGVCGTVELVRGGSDRFRCTPCRAAGLRKGMAAVPRDFGQAAALGAVGAAIREGRLIHPRLLRCVDCTGPAVEYEHRDYNRPLHVDPICRRCNLLRGPGIPLAGSIELALKDGRVPYTLRANVVKLARTMGREGVADSLPARLTLDHWRALWPALTATA